MNLLKELFYVYSKQNFEYLSNPNYVWIIYFLVFIIIFLENGFLLAAFLPGDSLLILFGVLIAKEHLSVSFTLFLLTISAFLGGWVGYLQGNLLGNNKWIQKWITYLPDWYAQKAYKMFYHYGLFALFFGRFLAFIRTLLPMIAGISGLNSFRFHLYNIISSFLWIGILIFLGFLIGRYPLFQNYTDKFMLFLIIVSFILLIISITSILIVIFKKNL